MNETFIALDNWKGLYDTISSYKIPLGNSPSVLGCDFRSKGSVSPCKGYSTFGNLNATAGRITSSIEYERTDGTDISLVLVDDGTNAILYYLNTLDVRNNVDGEWTKLVSLTTGYLIGGGGMNYYNGATLTDLMVFGNGTDNFSSWSPYFTTLDGAHSSGDTTVTVASTTNFGTTGSFVITADDGTLTAVAYTGKTATTFTGVTNMPNGTDGVGIAPLPDTTTYSTHPKGNIFLFADSRCWVAGYNSIRLYASGVGDPTDFTVPSPETPDSPLYRDFSDIGGRITGLGAKDYKIQVFGKKATSNYWLEFPTDSTRVSKSKTFRDKSGVNAVNHLGIASVINDIWFVTNEKSVLSLFSPSTKEGFDTDQITEKIRATMDGYEFDKHASGYTSARAIFFDKQKRYLLACRTGTDIVDNDKVIDVQFVKDLDTGDWNKEINLLDWPVGCWFKRGSDVYFGSSVEPKAYKAFDGRQAGTANSPLRFKYITKRLSEFGALNQFKEKKLDTLAFTGLIAPGSSLNFKIYFDSGGSRGTLEATLSYTETGTGDDDGNPILVMEINTPNTLGQFTLGAELLGGLQEDVEDLNPFRVYFVGLQDYSAYDFQIEITAEGTGLDFSLEGLGLDISDSQNKIEQERKKSFS